ncbi:hemerythrin domain-containing protein [Pseudonocardia sp. T1-2H]|uniref:hemerythrin domain-containing protein n=1 Tax=Pseudonocardia sp. T1-2H TaxID=3128899 RepID=UPI003101562A
MRAVARLVFTHAFAEEAVLFPAARRALPEGDLLTLRIETDHQEVDELVTRLDRSSAEDPGRSALLERTFAVLDEDVRTEEDELRPACSRSSVRAGSGCWGGSGSWCGGSRRPGPPVVSRRPPGQTLSALPLTVLDRSRDRLQQLDERTGGIAEKTLSSVDRVLAATAGAVERLPPMRRGERPETSR